MEGVVNPFWRGKRVFITGHTGFKGSWLSLWLQQLSAVVSGYALDPPSTPNLYTAANIETGMQSTHGDIRDLHALQASMQAVEPEIVFHLAAQSLVRASYRSPLETFSTNVIGTANLLDCARQCPSVRAVVVVTSDKCYQNKEWDWPYREIDALGGHDPYSTSKACAELVTSCYRSSFFKDGPDVATARAGNVIGGGDWAQDRLIPDIVRGFSTGQVVRIRNPHALRPWQHVLDPLRGYLLLAQSLVESGPQFAGAWNFGPNSESIKPVEWIVERLAEAWGASARWEIDRSGHPHEAHTLTLDASKAAARLGWRPLLRLDEALAMTAAWYQRYLRGEDVREACIEQITAYGAK